MSFHPKPLAKPFGNRGNNNAEAKSIVPGKSTIDLESGYGVSTLKYCSNILQPRVRYRFTGFVARMSEAISGDSVAIITNAVALDRARSL
jgi:hypothetical protein